MYINFIYDKDISLFSIYINTTDKYDTHNNQ